MLKIGVLGAGHLGKIHIQLLKENSNIFDLIGFYDQNTETAKSVSEKFNISSFPNAIQLVNAVDAVLIVTPTSANSVANFKSRISPLSLKTIVLPLKKT